MDYHIVLGFVVSSLVGTAIGVLVTMAIAKKEMKNHVKKTWQDANLYGVHLLLSYGVGGIPLAAMASRCHDGDLSLNEVIAKARELNKEPGNPGVRR